jgi:hypothetical protein
MKYYLKIPMGRYGNDIWTIEFVDGGVLENILYDCEKPYYKKDESEMGDGEPTFYTIEVWYTTFNAAFGDRVDVLTETEAFLEML